MRVGVVSDIHSNAFALDAVLAHAARNQIDAWWFLGDAVGYGPDPIPVVEFWRSLPPTHSVPGNHDALLARELSPEGFNRLALEALTHNEQVLRDKHPELLAWVQTQARGYEGWLRRHENATGVYVLVHGALADGSGPPVDPLTHVMTYVRPWQRRLVMLELMALATQTEQITGVACVFNGHTHIPCFMHLGGLHNGSTELVKHDIQLGQPMPLPLAPVLINPGSVGQPRDRDQRASYAILDQIARTITFHRVEYPVARTKLEMKRARFAEASRERLSKASAPDDMPIDWVL